MLKIKAINDKSVWERFMQSYPRANFLQSFNWGEFQKNHGQKIWRIGLFDQSELTGVCQFYLETAKRGPYLACPGGPLLDYQRADSLHILKKYLLKISEQEKAWFFRCRPQLVKDENNYRLFRREGFIKSPMHMSAESTLELDLVQEEAQILAKMRKNTRYAIRKAMQNPYLKIEASRKVEDIKWLYYLQLETTAKHSFIPFGLGFLTEQFKAFLADDQVLLYKVYCRDTVCAIAMIIFYHDEAVYHYAGNNLLAYQNNASYLIQWTAIREARRRKLKRYNFWGIVPQEKPKHRFWGVTIFKRGFGGNVVEFLPAHDLPFHPCYYLTYMFETFRKKIRRL